MLLATATQLHLAHALLLHCPCRGYDGADRFSVAIGRVAAVEGIASFVIVAVAVTVFVVSLPSLLVVCCVLSRFFFLLVWASVLPFVCVFCFIWLVAFCAHC